MLSYFKPQIINDGDSNGGSISIIPVFNYQRNNLFPDVSLGEIATGYTRPRKFFLMPEVQYDLLKVLILPSSAGDGMLIHIGTDDDTWLDAQNYTSWKGCGKLKEVLSAGIITSLVVEAEIAGLGFQFGDLIRIVDTGYNEDYVRIQSVSWNGKEATITPISNSLIISDYLIGDYVSACLEFTDINSQGLWIKEVIPQGSRPYINNLTRLIFKGRTIIYA
jgi:hypothetical protein